METSIKQMILFGGSGDLSLRMLFPSLYYLARDGLLPKDFHILAVARSIPASSDFRHTLKQALVSRIPGEYFDAGFGKETVQNRSAGSNRWHC